MPPRENDRLTAEQIELVRSWIAAGAPWPDEAEQMRIREAEWAVESNADGVIVKNSGGLADEWAFRPVKGLAIDEQRLLIAEGNESQPSQDFNNQQSTINNRQSQVISAKLTAAKVAPAPHAEPRTLICRASFDLIGLPPTPEEIEAFVAAWKTDPESAWEELTDRLLASPHYGERWAQRWFNTTRYANTGGMAKLAKVRQAGDDSEDEARMIVTTGFLRMGPWDDAMVSDADRGDESILRSEAVSVGDDSCWEQHVRRPRFQQVERRHWDKLLFTSCVYFL